MRDIDWKLEYEALERDIENMMQKTLVRYERYEAEIASLKETIADSTKTVGRYARDVKKVTEEKEKLERLLNEQQQKYKQLHTSCEATREALEAAEAEVNRLTIENETMQRRLEHFESSVFARFVRKEVR
ncbi:hypothetical protein EVJ20_07485 [Exiguobacterium sp. SH0S1]|uniref:hypothetical protein n=1 Tax=Exiguobacterium sp. SH0S1 TaxID=2510949 RepID=UPI00103AD9D9|nr:hypothetical protein [Exiguobacterium sp. SH0S1]TCI77794.1 hypothetical protein EVJ20_07485 [Exiguobacterium sp. SH0S1]